MAAWRGLVGALLAAFALALQAQPNPSNAPNLPNHSQGPARDLGEEVRQLEVLVQDAAGRRASVQIPITLYRPHGEGPFPLAVVSHGRGVPEQRRTMGRARYEALARYLVAKGFAVAVPTRAGYGQTYGTIDPEGRGSCREMDVDAVSAAAADQILAAAEHARRLPWVDGSRWLAIGQSVGGMSSLALAARRPEGLLAAINFAGGAGGNPDRRPGDPCQPQRLEELWRERGGQAAVPTLWLYWHNDQYWGAEVPRRWAAAWATGGGKVEFHQLPAAGRDGHSGLTRDMDHWVPVLEPWLAALGFTQAGDLPRPPASRHALIAEADKVPVSPRERDSLYQRFLAAKPPRAFAVGADGAAGWASGDWARGHALGLCQRTRGQPCRLYAVDDDVVWTETR